LKSDRATIPHPFHRVSSKTVTENTRKAFVSFWMSDKVNWIQKTSKIGLGCPSCLQTDLCWYTVPPKI
jgi:hypothetical protein